MATKTFQPDNALKGMCGDEHGLDKGDCLGQNMKSATVGKGTGIRHEIRAWKTKKTERSSIFKEEMDRCES